MSMTKLIYGSDFDPLVGVGAEIVDRQGELTKQASTIFGMDYSDMKPDDRHVGIHVVALGDEEHYPANRNGDTFPKEACVKYHDTFVKYGHVFRHHRNKDPEKAIGIVKASAYNEPMGRIELFIHADKEKAAPELERLEKEGEIPFSMAATVPFDVCSICGAMRKQAGDERECEHVRDHLGELYDDGRRVSTRNTEPRWFDISFVGRPADRIAWNLKVASNLSGSRMDSVKAAELAGIVVPDELACETGRAMRKLGYARDIAAMQRLFAGWSTKQASVATVRDGYLYSFVKLAASGVDGWTIDRLRELPVPTAMAALARNGIVLDVPSFLKYASGDAYASVVQPYASAVRREVPRLLSRLVEKRACARVCSDATYDALRPLSSAHVPSRLDAALRKQAFDVREGLLAGAAAGPEGVREIDDLSIDTEGCSVDNGAVVEKLAEAYVAYQLAAIDAVVEGRRGQQGTSPACSSEPYEAMAAVTNMTRERQ